MSLISSVGSMIDWSASEDAISLSGPFSCNVSLVLSLMPHQLRLRLDSSASKQLR